MRSSTRRPVTLRAFVALISAALVVGLWGLAAPAEALSRSPKECVGFSTCSKLGYGSSGYSKVYRKSHWGMVGGHNCTNYVAYRLQQAGVKKITKPGRGTAKHWGPAAKAKGIKVSKKNPKVGDVVWWSAKAFRNSTGHVGYVEAVNRKAGTVLVSEDNYRGNYQWLRDGKKIDGATKSTYEVKKADKDAEITVKVKGAKAGYASTTKTSKAIVAG